MDRDKVHTYFPRLVEFLEVLEQNPHQTSDQLADALGCRVNMISLKMRQLQDLPEIIRLEQEFLADLQNMQVRAEVVLQKRFRKGKQ